jgi:hypothetical protein
MNFMDKWDILSYIFLVNLCYPMLYIHSTSSNLQLLRTLPYITKYKNYFQFNCMQDASEPCCQSNPIHPLRSGYASTQLWRSVYGYVSCALHISKSWFEAIISCARIHECALLFWLQWKKYQFICILKHHLVRLAVVIYIRVLARVNT